MPVNPIPGASNITTRGEAPMEVAHWWDALDLDARKPDYFQVMMGLDDRDPTRVRNWIQTVEYQGFDPLTITKIILMKANSQIQLQEDAAKMITIAMTRGTVLTKIRKTCSTEGTQLLDELISRYSLVSTGTAGMDRKTAVTLARVCACFPVKCVHVMLLGNIMHPDQLPGFPWPLCFPAAAGIIPRHHTEMRESYKRWTMMFAARTTKRGATPASNEIALNLLEIGQDYYRCRMWNMAVYLMNDMAKMKLQYTNGTTLISPARVASLDDALLLVTIPQP